MMNLAPKVGVCAPFGHLLGLPHRLLMGGDARDLPPSVLARFENLARYNATFDHDVCSALIYTLANTSYVPMQEWWLLANEDD